MNLVLDRLRERTRPLHARLEGAVATLGFDASEAGYRRYLAKLLGFHAPLELDLARVSGLDVLGLELSARFKVPALRADLATLGLDARAMKGLAWCTFTPRIDGVPAALGALYVVEGSTLGGQFLFRQLSERLPRAMHLASRYLRVYGAATGARWRSFTRALTVLESEEARQSAEQAAVATFEAFESWLFASSDDQVAPPARDFA